MTEATVLENMIKQCTTIQRPRWHMQSQKLLGKSTIGSGNRGYEPALQHRRC